MHFRGNVLEWLQTFISDRTHTVSFQGQLSPPTTLGYGVPQGSVLGPLLFTMYTADVCDIVTSHGLSNHAYADDQQAYGNCRPVEAHALLRYFRLVFWT